MTSVLNLQKVEVVLTIHGDYFADRAAIPSKLCPGSRPKAANSADFSVIRPIFYANSEPLEENCPNPHISRLLLKFDEPVKGQGRSTTSQVLNPPDFIIAAILTPPHSAVNILGAAMQRLAARGSIPMVIGITIHNRPAIALYLAQE
jgi:hypothetical protein